MNHNITDFFEIAFALIAIAITIPLAAAGIYATITTIFL
jgi:hypothetical protein